MIECLPLSGFDLECVDGEWRTFYGCSLEGLFEFQERRLELFQLCQTADKTISELYTQDKRFRFLINRCLMLNGIKPAWVAIAQIEPLLFLRETEAGYRAGFLIELNTPTPVETTPGAKESPPATLEESIAALALHCKSIQEAIELSRNEPAKKVVGVSTAKAKLSRPPEQKQKEDLREFARQERAKARGGS